MDFRIVSFGTPEYEENIKTLIHQCRKFKLNYSIETISSTGDRKDATLQKPFFIRKNLDCPVLWLDVDTKIRKKFDFPDLKFDVGFVHRINAGVHPITSACILFNNTKWAKKFLDAWCFICSNKELTPLEDHARMLGTRTFLTKNNPLYMEVDITDHVRGKIILDYGKKKQYSI